VCGDVCCNVYIDRCCIPIKCCFYSSVKNSLVALLEALCANLCVAICCSALLCIAVCCNLLQCAAQYDKWKMKEVKGGHDHQCERCLLITESLKPPVTIGTYFGSSGERRSFSDVM